MADIQTVKAELEKELAAVKALREDLEAMRAAAPVASGGIGKEDLKEILSSVAEASAAPTNLLAKKLKPENAEGRKLGPYEHPDGGEKFPKPLLPCDVYWGCKDVAVDTRAVLRVRHDELTYAEPAAILKLYESLGNGDRRVCRDGKWRVTKSDFGDRMDLMVPIHGEDTKRNLPSFLLIVQELTSGKRSASAAMMAERVALLEEQLAALTATSAVSAA